MIPFAVILAAALAVLAWILVIAHFTAKADAETAMLRAIRARRAAEATP